MASKPITIGTRYFKSQTEAKQYYQNILRNEQYYRKPIRGNDFQALIELLKKHPHKTIKFGGCDISSIWVDTSRYNTKCFRYQRTDGSIDDFSYTEPITPKSDRQKLTIACRNEVEMSKILFRDTVCKWNSSAPCQLCGCEVKRNDSHIHHSGKEFKDIFQDFLSAHPLTKAQMHALVRHIHDDDYLLLDPVFKKLWLNFHEQNVSWQYLCIPCHNKAHGRKTITPVPEKKEEFVTTNIFSLS